MTAYGPYKRLVIRTSDTIVTLIGKNMIATVTGCDQGGSPPQCLSATSEGSHTGTSTSETHPHDGCPPPAVRTGAGHEASSMTTSDMESISVFRYQLPSEDIIPCHDQSGPTVLGDQTETEVDGDSDQSNDIGSATDECGSLDPSHPKQGYATPSSPISSEEETSAELPLSGNKRNRRECSDNEDELSSVGIIRERREDSEEVEKLSVVQLQERVCNSTSESSGEVGGINVGTSNSGLQSQSTEGKYTLKEEGTKTLSYTERQAHHAEERPYMCDICGKTFKRRSHITRHLLWHSGEKPYSCDTCGKIFAQSGNLSQHVRNVHRGEKPHTCGTCGKTFKRISHLTRHLRTQQH